MKEQRLYLFENPYNMFKIGISVNPERRKRQVELASGMPIYILKCWQTLDATAFEVEQAMHIAFARRRMPNGEWFKNMTIQDIELAGFELRECLHDGTIMAQYKHGEQS